MSETRTYLQNNTQAKLAFVLRIDGLGLAYTTSDDIVGLNAYWTPTIKAGLEMPAEISQSVNPFDSKIVSNRQSFNIVDTDGYLLGLMGAQAAGNRLGGAWSRLLQAVEPSDTSISVHGYSGDITSPVYIGAETVLFDSTSTTGGKIDTLIDCTRGYNCIFSNEDGDPYARYHRRDVLTGQSPSVTTVPTVWHGRCVALYLSHKRADGTWTDTDDAEMIWCGMIQGWKDQNQKIILDCISIHEKLAGVTLMRDRYEGQLQEGMYLHQANAFIQVREELQDGSGSVAVPTPESLPNSATYTWEQLVSNINYQLQNWIDGADVNFQWNVTTDWDVLTGEPRVSVSAVLDTATSADIYRVAIALSPSVWRMLGWYDVEQTGTYNDGTYSQPVAALELQREADVTTWTLTAPNPPLARLAGTYGSDTIVVSGERGTFYPQTNLPAGLPEGTEGFLKVGESIYAVAVSSESANDTTFTLVADATNALRGQFLDNTFVLDGADVPWGAGEPVKVAQVWIEAGKTADIMLKLLLSTGETSYNSADYDVLPLPMCGSIPYSLINVDSFLQLGQEPYLLYIDEPISLVTLLESVLALRYAHLVFRDGQLVAKRLGTDVAVAAADTAALTESNKAVKLTSADMVLVDRSACEYGSEGLINKVTVKYQRVDGAFKREVTVNATSSQSDFGTSGITVEAYGVYEGLGFMPGTVRALISDLAARGLSYFSRPLAIMERSINAALAATLCPGDLVSVTDNYLADPVDGTRGVSSKPMVVLAAGFRWADGVGKVKLLFNPELDSTRFGLWAPSARISSYNNGTKTLTCAAHTFSSTGEAVDASNFSAGNKVRIIEESPSNVASPTTYLDTVVSVSGNDIVLTTGLGGALPAGTFVIEFDDILVCQAGQRNKCFYADDALSTGMDDTDAYIWVAEPAEVLVNDPVYTTKYRKTADLSDDKGEPHSVHKWYALNEFANCALAYQTSPHYVNEQWTSSNYRTQTGTTHKLVYGPLKVYLRGGNRSLVVRARLRNSGTAGTASVKVIASRSRVKGSSNEATQYSDVATQSSITLTTTSTSYTFVSGILSKPIKLGGSSNNPPGTWITVEVWGSGAGVNSDLAGIMISEAAT